MQKGAFLCSEPSVEVSIELTKKFTSGLFGGEGFILQGVKGKGALFLEIDGDAVTKDLQPGEVIKVDTGNVVAFEKSVSYTVETVKGLSNIFLGGEGLFLTTLTGPGKVYLQTMPVSNLVGLVTAALPKK